MPKDPFRHFGLNYDTDRSSSSESEDDHDLEMYIADATPEGIPDECFCGRRMRIHHEPSGAHKGRAYYACNQNETAPPNRSNYHFRKWLDMSMNEEVKALKNKFGEQAIRIHQLESENTKKTNEIEELKGRLLELEVVVLGKSRR